MIKEPSRTSQEYKGSKQVIKTVTNVNKNCLTMYSTLAYKMVFPWDKDGEG